METGPLPARRSSSSLLAWGLYVLTLCRRWLYTPGRTQSRSPCHGARVQGLWGRPSSSVGRARWHGRLHDRSRQDSAARVRQLSQLLFCGLADSQQRTDSLSVGKSPFEPAWYQML